MIIGSREADAAGSPADVHGGVSPEDDGKGDSGRLRTLVVAGLGFTAAVLVAVGFSLYEGRFLRRWVQG